MLLSKRVQGMMTMSDYFGKVFLGDDGQGLSEYALIAALLSIVAIVLIIETGDPVELLWDNIEVALSIFSGGE